MEEIKQPTRRLTKKPPPSVSNNYKFDGRNTDNRSLHSSRSSSSLQRAPSAPTYPKSHNHQGHTRQSTSPNPAIYAHSSNSSLDRQISGPSPILSSSEFTNAQNSQGGGNQSSSSSTRLSLNEKSAHDLLGAPFDGSSILNHIDSTKATGYQNALRRPPPPPLSHTSPDTRLLSPSLRTSASFTAGDRMNEKNGPKVSENQLISPKRYSDESRDPKAGMIRKKSGFSGFMNSIGVGTPRGIKISAPENPVHVTHVGYDNQTGRFTVSLVTAVCSRILTGVGFAYGVAANIGRQWRIEEGARTTPSGCDGHCGILQGERREGRRRCVG